MPTESEWWMLLIAVLCAVACAVPGCFLVLRRLSMLGDAIAHAILPGIAVAFVVTGTRSVFPMLIGAAAAGLLTAILSAFLSRRGNVPEDAAMGVVFTSLFALGVLLITIAARSVDLDPGCVLYGLIEFAPLDRVVVLGFEAPRAAWVLGCAAAVNGALAWVFFKELKITSFDGALATTLGISAAWVHYGLMGVVAGTTVVSFEAVGSILVVAMLIGPPAAAHLLTDRLSGMIWIASGLAVVSAAAGFIGALWLNTSVAGMMGVAAGVIFALAAVLAPRHGAGAKALRRGALSLRIMREDVLGMLYRAGEVRPDSPLARETIARAMGGGLIVRAALWGLVRGGLVVEGAGGLRLTRRGEEDARRLVRGHRLWESYLARHLGLPVDHLHDPSERMEHYITPDMRAGLDAEIRDNVDPMGKRIPKD